MKVTNEKTENRQAYLKIEVEPAEVDAATAKAFKRLVKQVNVPGFRRGNAPRPIFERNFGKDRLFHEALDDLVPDVYKKAIDELKLETVARPEIKVEQESPVVLSVVTPLKPVITLGDYRSIDVKKPQMEITDEMVDRVIDRLRHQHATWEPVDRAAAIGDMVTIDLDSTAKSQPFINRKGLEYHLDAEISGPVPGFAGEIVGMKKGEEREFSLKFPENYQRKEFAGADAAFKVKLDEVKREVLPELDDKLAVLVNKDYTTVDVLKQKVREQLTEQAEHEAEHAFEDQVIDAATSMSKVEYPPVMLESEVDHLLERNFRYLEDSGQDIAHYLQTIGKTVEQVREDLKPAAQKRVAESLVLGRIADEEKLEVTPAEIDAEIENVVNNSQGTTENKASLRKALNDEHNREHVLDTLITRKVIKKLTDIAASKEVKPPAEASAGASVEASVEASAQTAAEQTEQAPETPASQG